MVLIHFTGGDEYGNPNLPAIPGSGGGNATSLAGGAGGGVIQIFVSGSLTLGGLLSANGLPGTNGQVPALQENCEDCVTDLLVSILLYCWVDPNYCTGSTVQRSRRRKRRLYLRERGQSSCFC